MGFRKQCPGTRIFKYLKDLLEEFIKPLEHPDAIKHVVYDVEPPEPFTLLQFDRIRCGKNWWRRVAKGTLKGLRNRCLRVGSLPKPVLNRIREVDLCHRTINMKQRLSCIKKDNADWGLHWSYESSQCRIVVRSKIRSQNTHLSCDFLTKNTPTASFDIVQ